jgi:hypothetical protein
MQHLTLAVMLTLAAAPAFGQNASTQKGWLRTSVAAWEEPDRTEVLSFLDAARKASDFIATSLDTNDRKSADKLMTPRVLREWGVAAQSVAALRAEGQNVHLEYRNQAFELRSTLTDSEVPTARTWYAITLPGPAIARSFVSVVIEEHDGRAGSVVTIEPVSYQGDVPTWLLHRDALLAPPASKAH